MEMEIRSHNILEKSSTRVKKLLIKVSMVKEEPKEGGHAFSQTQAE